MALLCNGSILNSTPARPALHAKNCKPAKDRPRPGPDPPEAAPKIADADEAAIDMPARTLLFNSKKEGSEFGLLCHVLNAHIIADQHTEM